MAALEKQSMLHELFKIDLTVVISAEIEQLKQTIKHIESENAGQKMKWRQRGV
jgi:hypothetical protein